MVNDFFRKYRLVQIMFVLVTLLSSMAVFSADTTLNPYLDSSNMVRVALSYLAVFYMIASLFKRDVKKSQLEFLGVVFIWWFISVFHTAYGEAVQWNILMFMLLIVYSYFRPRERAKVYELYRYYIILMCCGGILAYLFYFLSVPFPCSVVPYYTGTEVQRHIYSWGFYYNYYIGFVNVSGPLVRLCGWFNEPGYLGTIGSLILIADNVNLKHRGNIIILVAMVFTFSLAALVIIGGYLLTMAMRKGKMVVAMIIFVFAATIIIPAVFENNATYQYFVQRLEYKNGEFRGDNRVTSSLFKRLQKQQFREVGTTLFGYGTNALRKYGKMGILGIEVQLYLYGIIGLLLTYGLLFLLAWKLTKGSYQAKCFVIWFFLSAYQRPYIFAPDYILILFGGIAFIKANYSKKKFIDKEEEEENRKKSKMKKVEEKDYSPLDSDTTPLSAG